MGRTKKFLLNSLSTAIYQVLLMITGFITPLVMLRYYGSEVNGLISSISQFIVYFNLVEAGLSAAAIYALYKPLAKGDYSEINGVVSAAKKFYFQAGYIFVSLTLGLAIFYPMFVESGSISNMDMFLLVLILGVNGALEFFTLAKYRVILTADQKTYIVSIASMVHIIVNTILIVILAYMQVDLVILRFVALLSIFLRSFILMFYVKRKYKYIDFNFEPNFKPLDKRWDALYLQVLGAIQVGAPIVILTLVTKDLLLVSVFTIYNLIIGGLRGILGIFKSGLSASFGEVIAKNETKILQKSYQEFEYIYYLIITCMFFVAFVMIMPFVSIYTNGINDTNYILPLVGFLFVLDGLLYSMKNPQGMLVLSAGLFKETRLQATIQGLILIVLGIVLTYKFGLIGVLVASIISNLYRLIDLLIFVPKKITKLPIRYSAYRVIRVFVLILFMILPLNFIDFNPQTYFSWFLNSAILGIYSLIMSLLFGLIFDKEDLFSSIKRFTKII